MAFLRKVWYVAGWASELAPGQLLSRRICDEPILPFHDEQGAPHALFDRCPHCFAPLSSSRIQGDNVQCGYHGLSFNGQGVCIDNPHGPTPKAACVRAYPVRKQDKLLWIWMGDPANADDSLIPDLSVIAAAVPDAQSRGYPPTACDAMLLVDSIMDLFHVDYLHLTTMGSSGISRVDARVNDLSSRSVKISWLSSGDLAPPAFDMQLRQHGQPTDQYTEVTWHAPSNMVLVVGAALQGESRSEGANTLSLHLSTPATKGHTHYWYWSTRDFAISAEANAFIRCRVVPVFTDKDKPMLEAQQRNMGDVDFWAMKPVMLAPDAGAVRVRRELKALVEAEGLAA